LYKKLGIQSEDNLNDFEVEAFLLIESEIEKHQEMKAKRKKR
jgi:hypothetical protein